MEPELAEVTATEEEQEIASVLQDHEHLVRAALQSALTRPSILIDMSTALAAMVKEWCTFGRLFRQPKLAAFDRLELAASELSKTTGKKHGHKNN